MAYDPEDIVTHSLYAKITFVNASLFPDVYFVSFNNCVFIVSSLAIVLGHNICVCHLLCNKKISVAQKTAIVREGNPGRTSETTGAMGGRICETAKPEVKMLPL